MRTDVRTRLREYVGGLAVPGPDIDAVVAAAGQPPRGELGRDPARPTRPWLVPVLAAVAVVVVVFSVGVAPALPGPDHQPGAGSASLPDRIAGYSYLTGSVSSDPPGRAVALYQHGVGVELFDFPQALVLSADDDVYRRVDVAEARSAELDQGDPAPMRLSPDGSRVAIGSNGGAGDLAVVDLVTGEVTSLPARLGASVVPLTFSPDGRHVIALESVGDVNPLSGSPTAAAMARFDLNTGEVTRYPTLVRVTAAAFSPDGRELAVQNGSLVVVDPDTGVVRRILAESGLPLRSGAAWSPAGEVIAVGPEATPRIAFVDASGLGRAVPAPVEGVEEPLGWTGPRTLIVKRGPDLVEVDVVAGTTRVLSEVDIGPSANYMLGQVHLATGMLDHLVIRSAGRPDRGIWPAWAIVAATVVTGGIATLLVAIGRAMGRHRRAAHRHRIRSG
jgi:hypothetical protein